MKKFMYFAILTFTAGSVFSVTIHVPSDQLTIQAGIDAAVDGDTVLVADGVYYERISYLGKPIVVASDFVIDGDTLHISSTVIDADTAVLGIADTGSVVRFVNDEDTLSVLLGLTIRNGTGTFGHGGGIFCNQSTPSIRNCSITYNTYDGVYASPGQLLIVQSSIRHNMGHGVYLEAPWYHSYSQFRFCVVSNNSGSGIEGNMQAIFMTDCVVSYNQGHGVNTTGPVSCLHSIVKGNGGHGISMITASKPEQGQLEGPRPSILIANSVIDGNGGTGIYVVETELEITDVTISNNFGSGYIFKNSSSPVFTRVHFIGNSGILGGGFACLGENGGTVSFNDCRFDDNVADLGGAIYFTYNPISLNLSDCQFRNNSAVRGGAIYSNSIWSGHNITGCTFVGNCSDSGAAVQLDGRWLHATTLHLENSLFAFNCSDGGFGFDDSGGSVPVITCNDIFGNQGGDWVGSIASWEGVDGNISADPLFCDTAAANFYLNYDSPCAPANNACNTLIGALGVGCLDAQSLISPDTMYALQAYNTDSLLVTILFGDFADGRTVNDVDVSTLLINGTLAPVSWSILPSYPGFTGDVMQADVLMAPFILGYGPLFDITTQAYTLEGLFNDATEFSSSGEVVMVGHLSGDVNLDGAIDVSDLTYLVEFLFGGGPAPRMFETADLDGSGTVDISDLSALVEYLFS